MTGFGSLTKYARAGAAAIMMASTYLAARPATLSRDGLIAVAGGLRFENSNLGNGHSATDRRIREVHPSLRNISSWISSVGAGIALADLDGNGLPNDACHVDPRTDSVTVRPVPGIAAAYDAVTLVPPPVDRPQTTAPMGCLAGDIDEDGRLDLVVYFWGRTPVAFLQRGSPGRLAYTPYEIVPGRERWYTNAALFADVNGDGHADLVFGNYFPDGARILDATAEGVESMQQSMSRASNGGSKQLWIWQGVVEGLPRFASSGAVFGPDLATGWTLALGAADLDGDARPELMFVNDFGPDHLFHNRSTDRGIEFALLTGERHFTTPASKVLGHDSFKGMGVEFGDVNGDGWLDLFVSNIAAEFALEESHQLFLSTGQVHRMRDAVAPFDNESERLGVSRSGWAWDARLADFDNDGTLELVQATGFIRGATNRWPELHELAMGNDVLLRHPRFWPRFQPGDDLSGHDVNPMFVRRGDGRFHDVARLVGTDHSQITRGLAIADVNRDGLLEYAAANQWQPSRFYQNVSQQSGAFVGLNVLYAVGDHGRAVRVDAGTAAGTPGSPAFGATVRVSVPDGRRWVSQVDGGSGHSGKRAPEVHVGLGPVASDTPVTVEILWRTREGRQQAAVVVRPGWHTVWLPPRGARPATVGGDQWRQ